MRRAVTEPTIQNDEGVNLRESKKAKREINELSMPIID
jgi:hypothetical protein